MWKNRKCAAPGSLYQLLEFPPASSHTNTQLNQTHCTAHPSQLRISVNKPRGHTSQPLGPQEWGPPTCSPDMYPPRGHDRGDSEHLSRDSGKSKSPTRYSKRTPRLFSKLLAGSWARVSSSERGADIPEPQLCSRLHADHSASIST